MANPHGYICCYIRSEPPVDGDTPCEQPAEWEIVDGPAPDDYTYACTAHVGPMLQAGRVSTVYEL